MARLINIFGPKNGRSEAPFNLNRVKTRLEGFTHYASVSALLLNAVLRLESGTPTKLDGRPTEDAVKVLFKICVAACVVLGSYTATVFSMLSLYSKSFIGMGMDNEYLDFFNVTSGFRKSAFGSFVGTVLSFNIAVVLSIYLSNDKGRVRFWLTAATATVVLYCAQQWYMIMQYASVMYQHAEE